MARRAKAGRPLKGSKPLNRVLFIRCDDRLADALDAALQDERERRPGLLLSQADLARELLYKGLELRTARLTTKT